MAKTEAAPASKARTATEEVSLSAELELAAAEGEVEAEEPALVALPLEAAGETVPGMEAEPDAAEDMADGTIEAAALAVFIDDEEALAALAVVEEAAGVTEPLGVVTSFP